MRLKLAPPHGYAGSDKATFDRLLARPWHDLLLAERLYVHMDVCRSALRELAERRLLSGFRARYDKAGHTLIDLYFDVDGYESDLAVHWRSTHGGDPLQRVEGLHPTVGDAIKTFTSHHVAGVAGLARTRGVTTLGTAPERRATPPSPAAPAAAPQPTPNAPQEDA